MIEITEADCKAVFDDGKIVTRIKLPISYTAEVVTYAALLRLERAEVRVKELEAQLNKGNGNG